MVFGAILLQLLAMNVLTQPGETCSINPECSGQPQLLDLGRGYYPRYLSSLDCGSVSCSPYSCTPRTYRVKVLRRRMIEDITVDGSLPESLREAWRFVYVTVSVACICKFYNQQQ